MYAILVHGDEKYISGLRKNAIAMTVHRSDAIVFPTQRCACDFIMVLLDLFDEDAVYSTVKIV